jgi:hypothetical protein
LNIIVPEFKYLVFRKFANICVRKNLNTALSRTWKRRANPRRMKTEMTTMPTQMLTRRTKTRRKRKKFLQKKK